MSALKCKKVHLNATKCSQELPKTQNYKPCGSRRKYKQCCGK
ncbi:MAG: SEC-C domain-containing protein [Bacilli bacterium]|nr:SEC-C domain-containing protein [Bacilli bacterium]